MVGNGNSVNHNIIYQLLSKKYQYVRQKVSKDTRYLIMWPFYHMCHLAYGWMLLGLTIWFWRYIITKINNGREAMHNQRSANSHKAALSSDNKISLNLVLNIITQCKIALENDDKSDAAFYFEQIEEHIRNNPYTLFEEKVERILGL